MPTFFSDLIQTHRELKLHGRTQLSLHLSTQYFPKIFYANTNKQLLTDYLTRKRKSISMKKKFENVIKFYMMLFSSFEKFTLEGNIFSYFDSFGFHILMIEMI